MVILKEDNFLRTMKSDLGPLGFETVPNCF